jgi:hypothetical protein
MSIHQEADLILKLYELRRDPTMRIARDWCFLQFHPESREDVDKTMFGEHSGHLRMIISYWDMAAALVNHGAISLELFLDTNGEYLAIFAKLEPFLAELRTGQPNFLSHLEKLIDATPGGRQQVAAMRERMKMIRAQVSRAAAARS